jgi:hypothetical protein
MAAWVGGGWVSSAPVEIVVRDGAASHRTRVNGDLSEASPSAHLTMSLAKERQTATV